MANIKNTALFLNIRSINSISGRKYCFRAYYAHPNHFNLGQLHVVQLNYKQHQFYGPAALEITFVHVSLVI